MARRKKPAGNPGTGSFRSVASHEAEDESSLLDVLDNVLNKGAVLNGDVVLGVADVDLIYVKLSVLLAAFDKVTKNDPGSSQSRQDHEPATASHEREDARSTKPKILRVPSCLRGSSWFRYRSCTPPVHDRI